MQLYKGGMAIKKNLKFWKDGLGELDLIYKNKLNAVYLGQKKIWRTSVKFLLSLHSSAWIIK